MNPFRDLQRPLLYSLVGSVIFGAVLGILVVLRNTWGWFEVRVILTTITIAIASLCGLACNLSRTPRGKNVLPTAGLILTFLAAGLILFGMWTDLIEEAFWKTTVCVSIFAVATVHVCLLSIAKLASRFRWVFYIACQVIYGLATLLAVFFLWEVQDEGLYRLAAAVSIVAAALTLVIPILHRLSRSDGTHAEFASPLEQRNAAAIDDEIARLKQRIADLERLRDEVGGGREVSGERSTSGNTR